jgi:hypothetical protein
MDSRENYDTKTETGFKDVIVMDVNEETFKVSVEWYLYNDTLELTYRRPLGIMGDGWVDDIYHEFKGQVFEWTKLKIKEL